MAHLLQKIHPLKCGLNHPKFDNKWHLCYNTCIDLIKGEIMNEFDEQTDFSFLNLTMSEPETSTVKKSRSVPSDSPATFSTMIVSWTWNHTPETRAKISAGLKRYYSSRKNVKI